jgi:hypothetical protein
VAGAVRLSQTAIEVETASHFCSFEDSRLQSLPLVVREQKRGKSEWRSVMERIGVETSPHAPRKRANILMVLFTADREGMAKSGVGVSKRTLSH